MKYNIIELNDLTKKGVYKIENLVNHKVYIGSTRDSFKTRLKTHLSRLRRGVHENLHLQGAFCKYSEENFELSILYIGENKEDILTKEQEYINMYNSCNPKLGYNLDPIVDRSVRSKETNKKISETLKRKFASGEIKPAHTPCKFKGKKRPEHGLILRGHKISILITTEDDYPIVIFRGQLDIEEYTLTHKLPFMKIGPHSSKGYYISRRMVAKYVKSGKVYKGLKFKKVEPLSPEMGVAKWINCWEGETPNQQPSSGSALSTEKVQRLTTE